MYDLRQVLSIDWMREEPRIRGTRVELHDAVDAVDSVDSVDAVPARVDAGVQASCVQMYLYKIHNLRTRQRAESVRHTFTHRCV